LNLQAALAGVSQIRILDAKDDAARNSYYCLTAVLQGELKDQRAEVIEKLRAAGVGTSVYYPQPVPRMTYYREKYGYDESAYPEATVISDQSIALPVGPHLSDEDVEYVGESFRRVIKELAHV
jgi:dTDP-4-amino-4,6-dideoxygalactose transaminase